jgi:hypothetical protein
VAGDQGKVICGARNRRPQSIFQNSVPKIRSQMLGMSLYDLGLVNFVCVHYTGDETSKISCFFAPLFQHFICRVTLTIAGRNETKKNYTL